MALFIVFVVSLNEDFALFDSFPVSKSLLLLLNKGNHNQLLKILLSQSYGKIDLLVTIGTQRLPFNHKTIILDFFQWISSTVFFFCNQKVLYQNILKYAAEVAFFISRCALTQFREDIRLKSKFFKNAMECNLQNRKRFYDLDQV